MGRLTWRSILGWAIAGLAVGGWAYPEGHRDRQSPTPTVLAGDDIGFRMEGRRGSVPIGRLVVRIDGEWTEVEFAHGIKRISE